MASLYDLYVEQGAEFTQLIDLQGDWTGNTLSMDIVDSVGSVHSGNISWYNATIGTFSISIPNTSSSQMTKGVGRYNVESTDQYGKVDRVIQGRIYIDGDIIWVI